MCSMKLKKAMACMLAGAMVLSMGAVLPAAASRLSLVRV